MRLYLSSQDLGNHADVALKMIGANKRVAFVRNARDDDPEEDRNLTMPEKKAQFEAAGFEFEELDLRHYFGKQNELTDKLNDFGMVWCSGGNTFILRRAMKGSGLDELLTKLLQEDKIMYGGSSAGSCIAAPSLHGIERGDRPSPDIVPDEYPIKETLWDGLNLVPYMIVPHYNSTWFKKEADSTIKYLEQHGVEYKSLEDGQVIVVNDEGEELLP